MQQGGRQRFIEFLCRESLGRTILTSMVRARLNAVRDTKQITNSLQRTVSTKESVFLSEVPV